MAIGEGVRFLARFLRQPTQIGALWPSSDRLACKMVEGIDWNRVDAAVEYGPGTGVFTRRVLASMKPGARLIAIEREPAMAAALQERFPEVSVCQGDVVDVGEYCARAGIAQVDAVVSGLPWAFFEADKQKAILAASAAVLREGGQFVTFAYLQGLLLPAGQRFRRLLRQSFSEVTASSTEWLNLPPAFVYRCRK